MTVGPPLPPEVLSAAMESVADSILITTPDGAIVYANPAFLRLLGYELDEVRGHDLSMLAGGRDAEARFRDLTAQLQAGQSWTGELPCRHEDGSTRELHFSISPIADTLGGMSHCVAVCRDFTEDRQLQGFVRHSQRREVIGAMAGGIAHDFNNILSIIIGYTECAAGDVEADSGVAKDLNQVLTAANRARELVQQILNFSHETEQEKRPVRLDILVKEVIKFLGAALPATVEMHLDVAAVNARISGDATRLHQLLMNLCTNAWQAMRETGGRLEVRLDSAEHEALPPELAAAAPAALFYRLSVTDSGGGMDEETRAQAFDPFFTTLPAGEGVGLGLYTAQEIVSEHGGYILIDSAPGKGTAVSVYLPAIEEAAPRDTAPAGGEPVWSGKGRVLVVDDEEPIARVIGRMLSKMGFEALVEVDPRRALDLITRTPAGFRLLVTDLTMPHMTGIELARAVRERAPGTPVILATGYGETLDGTHAQQAGIGRVLVKPVSRTEVAAAVQELCGDRARA